MKKIDVYIIDRATGIIKNYNPCYDFEIVRDYLSLEKSSFILFGDWTAEVGDFLIVKSSDTKVTGIGSFKPFYTGVIDSFEDDSIIAIESYGMFAFDFVAISMSGQSIEKNLYDILTYNFYFTNDQLNSYTFLTYGETSTPFSYQPSQPPTITSFQDYLVDNFKKYNVTVEVDFVKSLQQNTSNTYQIYFKIKKKTNKIQLKNNSYSFINWSVYENDGTNGKENKLWIVDKNNPTFPSNPAYTTILSVWYIDVNGNLTQSINDNVARPVTNKIYLYDASQPDAPTYLEIAQSELSGNQYAHEIDFDMIENDNFLTLDQLEIGLLVDIFYNGTIYSSVLTGYSVSSQNNFVSLKFGNIRSTLSQAIKNLS